MSYVPFYKILHTDSDGTTRELTSAIDITHKRGLGDKKTEATIRLRNDFPDSDASKILTGGNLIFAEGDTVQIYWSKNTNINTSTQSPLISGEVQELSIKEEENERTIEINITDKTTLLLDKQFPIYSTAEKDQAPELIMWLIEQVSDEGNRNYTITADYITNGGYIVTDQSDGSAFKTINYTTDWKPAYEVIKELSQPKNTGDDRAYIFYIDDNNEFHWMYPDQVVSTEVKESGGEVINLKLDKSTRDMVNMVIFKCGNDKNGNAIYEYYFDPTVETAKLKMEYKNWNGITEDMQAPESDFDWAGSTNDQVRTEAKRRGTANAQAVTAAFGDPRWEGDLTLKGTFEFTPGDLIHLTSYSYGLCKKKLRITDIRQNLSNSGWSTQLSLDEDEKAIKEST